MLLRALRTLRTQSPTISSRSRSLETAACSCGRAGSVPPSRTCSLIPISLISSATMLLHPVRTPAGCNVYRSGYSSRSRTPAGCNVYRSGFHPVPHPSGCETDLCRCYKHFTPPGVRRLSERPGRGRLLRDPAPSCAVFATFVVSPLQPFGLVCSKKLYENSSVSTSTLLSCEFRAAISHRIG